jgi:hypothetical protein
MEGRTAMKQLRCMAGLVCGSIIWCATLAYAQQLIPIGRVTALEGVVIRQYTGNPQAERLHLQSFVYQEDRIQTMAAAKVKLVLVDDTVLTLGPASSLRLTEYVYTPHAQVQKSVLEMVAGIFRVVVQKILPHGLFEVHTHNAVAAIRGTDWMAHVQPDATAVVVLEGQVAVRHARPDIGGTVILTAGAGTDVRGNAAPTPPKQWGATRVEALRQATTLR